MGKRLFYALRPGVKNFRKVDIILDPGENIESELEFSPIDIPNPINPTSKGKAIKVKGEVLRIPQDIFLVTHINSMKKKSFCKKGMQFDYLDNFGNEVLVDWCEGDFWPVVINNSKFFAIKI